jgi:outer membrane protein TolC
MANDYLNKVTDNVNLEVQTAHTSLLQAISQVSLTGNSLEKARENERKALERYEEGKTSVIDVIEAQTYRQASQINYVQAKVSAQGYYSDLIKALHKY